MIRKILLLVLLLMAGRLMAQTEIVPIESDGPFVISAVEKLQERVLRSFHYIYDSEGMKAACIIYAYDELGVVESRTLEHYRKGRLAVRMQYSSDEVLLFEERFSYDSHGSLKKRIQICYEEAEPVKTVETRRYRYGSDGRPVSAHYYLDGQEYYSY